MNKTNKYKKTSTDYTNDSYDLNFVEEEILGSFEEEFKNIKQTKKDKDRHLEQYSKDGDKYRPIGSSEKMLEPGFYVAGFDDYGIHFRKKNFDISELIIFPDSIANDIIDEFNKFWKLKKHFSERGEPHKRGFMLWGPPGSGKTCTISLMMEKFIKQGNIVFEWSTALNNGINNFRMIEPNRKLMVVIEDIDMICDELGYKEMVLKLLDGNTQHSDIIFIATTNYPELLPDRLINRPSRFDRIAYIGMPSKKDRELYLKHKSKTLSKANIKKWAAKTKGFSLAHLKEMIVSVEILKLDFGTTLRRMEVMRMKKSKSEDYENEMRGVSDFGFHK